MLTYQALLIAFFRRHKWQTAGVIGAGALSQILRIAIHLALAQLAATLFGFDTMSLTLFDTTGNAAGIPEGLGMVMPGDGLLTAGSLAVESGVQGGVGVGSGIPGWFWALPLIFSCLLFASLLMEKYLLALLGERLEKNLRERLFESQLKAKMSAFSQKPAGAYLLRYSGDLKNIRNLLQFGLVGLARDVMMLTIGLFIAASFAPRLVLALVPCILIAAPVLWFLNRKLYSASETRRNRRSGLLNFVQLRLQAMEMIKVYNRQVPEGGKFHRRSERLYEAGKTFQFLSSGIQALIPALACLMLTALLYMASHPAGTLSDKGLLSGFLVLTSLAPVLRRMARVTVHWQMGRLSFRKYMLIVNMEAEETASAEEATRQSSRSRLELKALAFSYHTGSETEAIEPEAFHLSGLNLRLKSPGLTLIKGASGTGKSTLVRLLLGTLEPDAGTIRLHRQPYASLDTKSIRKQFSLVSDAYPLLGKTVFEAISYSRRTSRRPRARRLLDKLQRGLPKAQQLDLDDPIGDLGSSLSAGQTKLLQVVRGLLARKPILLLDAPFDGLPEAAKKPLAKRIRQISQQRIVLILSREDLGLGLVPDKTLDLDRYARKPRLAVLAG